MIARVNVSKNGRMIAREIGSNSDRMNGGARVKMNVREAEMIINRIGSASERVSAREAGMITRENVSKKGKMTASMSDRLSVKVIVNMNDRSIVSKNGKMIASMSDRLSVRETVVVAVVLVVVEVVVVVVV